MNKDLKKQNAFTLAEGATHVGISHNIGGTFHRFVESFTHVGIFHITRRVAFTLAEGATHVGIFNNTRRVGFTLAEVLITLGIIGIVSAMTIPTLISKYQEMVFTAQFKKAYATINEAFRLAAIDFGSTSPRCGYWISNPYNGKLQGVQFVQELGKWCYLKDGEFVPLPNDYNGPSQDCNTYKNLVLNRLKIAKVCKGNGLEDGCIAKPGYKGLYESYKEIYPNLTEEGYKELNPNTNGYDSNTLNKKVHIYLLQNGMSIFSPENGSNGFYTMNFTVDINGLAGPNKWGYDLYRFSTKYEPNQYYPRIIASYDGWGFEKYTTQQMLNKIQNSQNK